MTLPQTKAASEQSDRVPLRQKIAYGLGGPVDILSVWVLVSVAYNVFNMELQMSPTQVAIILMALRLWDGLADPIMGWVSDNTRTRWGRRRPYIFVGAILAAITYPLIWWFPMDLSHGQIMVWVIGFGILFYTSFTIWAMPFQSLLMEMTPDYNERTRVTSVRGIFQAFAGLFVGFCWKLSLLPIFQVANTEGVMVDSPSNGMRFISLFIAVAILVLGILPAIFVRERYYESKLVKSQKRVKLISGLKETLSCQPFLVLCGFTILFLLGTSIYDSYGRYVGVYYVLGGDWGMGATFTALGTILYTMCSLIMIPVFRSLSMKIGKNLCLYIATSIVLLSAASTWYTFRPDLPYLMLLNGALIGVGYAGLWLMIPSMQVDVVDYDELNTGERREGSFASVFSWVLKLSFCVGYLIAGPLIEMTGFDAALGGDQATEVLDKMRVGYLVIPVIALVVALIILKYFPINRAKAAEIRKELEARRGVV
jgi:GPH family glycoside/pentoside/hexuronide:cation symporter